MESICSLFKKRLLAVVPEINLDAGGLRIVAHLDNSAPKTLAHRTYVFSEQPVQKLYQVVDLLEIYHPV